MQVIYFLFALEKFQCLFELISVFLLSTCVTFVNLCVLFPSPPLLSESTVRSAILTFYICTTQPSATNKGQRSSSRSS